MTTTSHFDYWPETQDDGTVRHLFVGTAVESDWHDLNDFEQKHDIKSHTFGGGFNGEQAFEEVELWTDDAKVAMLFKLTFGGVA